MPSTSAERAPTKATCAHPDRHGPPRCAQVEQLLVERNSLRSVVRAMGISRMIAAELAKKARAVSPPLPRLRSKKAQRRVGEALELDEV